MHYQRVCIDKKPHTEYGSLSPGLCADMALADVEMRVTLTILGGETVYRSGA